MKAIMKLEDLTTIDQPPKQVPVWDAGGDLFDHGQQE